MTVETGRAIYARLINEPLLLATEGRMLSSGGLALFRRYILLQVDWRKCNWSAFEDVIFAEQAYRRVKKLVLLDAALYDYRLGEVPSVSKSSATSDPRGRQYTIWQFIRYRYRLYARHARARGWNFRDDLIFNEALSCAIYCWNKDKRPIAARDWPYLHQLARRLGKILDCPSIRAKIAASPWPYQWFEEIVTGGYEQALASEKF